MPRVYRSGMAPTAPSDRTNRDVLRDLVRDAERSSVNVRASGTVATRQETAAVLDRCALALRLLLDNGAASPK